MRNTDGWGTEELSASPPSLNTGTNNSCAQFCLLIPFKNILSNHWINVQKETFYDGFSEIIRRKIVNC